ncbi:hypothetical protein E4T44_03382 [Aureobasidium sp. EXF-8845]|nr:hypothetical protein E4T44_03382 [Aureobasidium sp. EXF-8845]KAI4853763.1 hypothetical protein E4T45_04202 [Aureobasidium sp. EXF-8846]
MMLHKDVHVRLHYLKGQHNGRDDTEETLKRELACGTHTLSVLETIKDVRGTQKVLDLDLRGFCFVKAPTNFEDWASEQETKKALIPEVEDLLRQELEGCDEMHVINIKHENNHRELVHVDYTASSVESLVHKIIWRPIKCIASRSFIAIADGRGVDPQKDISTINTGTPMRYGKYRDGYHWYYMSEQAEDDVLLFKTYDSDQNVPSTTCLRTTFDIPDTTPETVSQSIEVQALIFTHPVSEQTVHTRQSEEEVELLKRRVTVLLDEISQSQAFVKAGVDLRQWESKQIAEQMRHLISDRDHSRAEAFSLSMQLFYLEDWIARFYTSWSSTSHYDLSVEHMQRLICSIPRLRQRLGRDEQVYPSYVQSMGPDAEIPLLRQQLQAQHEVIEGLKVGIHARVEDEASEAFVLALQTAVKHERRKDDAIIEELHQEIQRLHVALEVKTAGSEESTEEP